jgi:hypothetical protein
VRHKNLTFIFYFSLENFLPKERKNEMGKDAAAVTTRGCNRRVKWTKEEVGTHL